MSAKDPAYDAPTICTDFDRGFSLGYRKAAKEMTEQKEAIINATLDRVLEIMDKADKEDELWALKFLEVLNGVLALKGGQDG